MTPTQPPAAGLDLDALESRLPRCSDIIDGSAGRRDAWHELRDAAPALIARAREAEALRAEVERLHEIDGANVLNRSALRHARALCEEIEKFAFAATQSVLDDREPIRKEIFREIRNLARKGIAGTWESLELTRLDRDLAARDATIAELRAALGKACDIADEGWAYAEDYFRDKHLDTEQMARLRALANPSPTEG